MNPASAAALVLSAGFSVRMGDFKPLMTLGGVTLLERAVRLFQSVGVGTVHVVVGHRAAELTPRVEGLGARCELNPAYAAGMFSSVAAGAASLAAGTEAFFVLPVDIPLVRPSTLRELLAALPKGGTAVCHPTFGGRRGHPPLIGMRHIQRILSWREGGGLAALLRRLEAYALDVPVADEGIHLDMDRPEDHRCLTERTAGPWRTWPRGSPKPSTRPGPGWTSGWSGVRPWSTTCFGGRRTTRSVAGRCCGPSTCRSWPRSSRPTWTWR